MPLNPYFVTTTTVQGEASEQDLYEDLIIESISIWGVEMYYIPRTLVSIDNILGEDRLSQFKSAYPIEMYFESIDGFEGQGAFIEKFGLMMEQSATMSVARKRWAELIGQFGDPAITKLPNRPAEGDLLYFPLTGGLFEIRHVQHQNVFYQVGKLYTYQLQIELFVYGSEKMVTGNPDIDIFETIKSQDPVINDVDFPQKYGTNNDFREEAEDREFDVNNPFGDN